MATWLTAELVGDGAPSGGSGFGKLTRVTSGVNLPSLEVIMSRPFEENPMFKVLRCLSAIDIKADDVTSILDSHFHPELVPDGGSRRNGKLLSLDETLDEWGKLFEKRLPYPK